MIKEYFIDQSDSMYPSLGYLIQPNNTQVFPEYTKFSSVYGYSFGNSKLTINNKTVEFLQGQYFSFFTGNSLFEVTTDASIFLVVRLGYKCQDTIGWAESTGRLSYIDGCTDSLLVYPPRLGDPSLNLLHFPAGISQTRHLHPSIRIGCVVAGSGISDTWSGPGAIEHTLNSGDIFCLEQNELHRFRTTDSPMTVIAWHPDGDWGPTDHNHSMLNRTYLK
jgi:quercetin dioxygenase-like cupin family protein